MSDKTQQLELGNYRVLHNEDGGLWLLGKGGYGTTYKGEHKHLRRVCALKVINEHLVRNDLAKMRFLQEAQAAASLDHEHIAHIYDFGEADGLFYYAMTYCAGGDLEEYAERMGPQPWSVVEGLARPVFAALGSAHDQGLLHRDLKPSNVMLATADDPTSLRLIDFGLVKALGEEDPSETAPMRTQEGSFMGNPLTASPEQFREEDLDERSDLYSVGVTLWYLLVGGSPFGTASAAQIAHQRLTVEDYDALLPPDLDPRGRAILNRLLATDRERRFRNVAEVLEVLDGGEIPDLVPSAVKPTDEDFDELWQIEAQVRQFEYGTYYGSRHLSDLSVAPATLFIPEPSGPSYDQVEQGADRLLDAPPGPLCGFHARGQLDGARAYLCDPLPGGSFSQLLHSAGKLTLQHDTDFIIQVAEALDQAMALGIPGLEMGDSEILVGLDPALGRRLVDDTEWQTYFSQEARSGGGATTGLKVTMLPRLGDHGAHREASSTIGGDDLATNPIARFGAFLYRVLSGMSVKQSAYLTALNHVSFSDISEESNRYLAEVVAGVLEPGSAREVLVRLCELEGCLPAEWHHEVSASHGAPDPSLTLTSPIRSVPEAPAQPDAAVTSNVIPAAVSSGSVGQTTSVTVPPPPVRQAPPEAEAPKKGNRWPVIVAVLVVLGLLGAVAGWGLLPNDDENGSTGNRIDLPQETGSGTLAFSNLNIAGPTPSEVPLALIDAKGVTVGTFDGDNGSTEVKDFPLDAFDDRERWPLKFVSLDSRYLVEGPSMRTSDFSGRSGSEPVHPDGISLRVLEYVDVVPSIAIDGEPVNDLAVISPYISPKDPDARWTVVPREEGLRVLLEPGGTFPVTASVAVPGLKRDEMEIARDSTPSADLGLEERSLEVVGLGASGSLRFEPDLSQIDDESLREIYTVLDRSTEIEARELMAKRNKWRLPKLPGSVVIRKGGREGRVLVAHDARYLVLAGVRNRLEVEDQDLVELRELAEQGQAISQYRLALKYYEDHNGEVADELAYGWALIAGEAGDAASQYTLGILYRDGIGVSRDPQRAAMWFRRAAENGHGGGMSGYGWCFRNGFGVDQDDMKAEEWFLKSAEKRDLFGMNNLGLLYGDRDSDLYDAAKSFEWLEKASEAGSVDATFNLAFTYHYGLGTPVDLDKARELYSEAAEDGHAQAREALEALDQ